MIGFTGLAAFDVPVAVLDAAQRGAVGGIGDGVGGSCSGVRELLIVGWTYFAVGRDSFPRSELWIQLRKKIR